MVIEFLLGTETAKIDEIDSDLVSFKWGFLNGYAVRSISVNGKGTRLFMHRVILERSLERSLLEGEVSDHINGNPLDNRRVNLRLATKAQNAMNRGINANSKSGYKGVSHHKSSGRWNAMIGINGKQKSLGYFNTPEEAAQAYNESALELHGEFARLNTIPFEEKEDRRHWRKPRRPNKAAKRNPNPDKRDPHAPRPETRGRQLRSRNSKSGYKGVYWNKSASKWVAQIVVQSQHIYLGCFINILEAARAYNAAAIEHFGSLAVLNTIPE